MGRCYTPGYGSNSRLRLLSAETGTPRLSRAQRAQTPAEPLGSFVRKLAVCIGEEALFRERDCRSGGSYGALKSGSLRLSGDTNNGESIGTTTLRSRKAHLCDVAIVDGVTAAQGRPESSTDALRKCISLDKKTRSEGGLSTLSYLIVPGEPPQTSTIQLKMTLLVTFECALCSALCRGLRRILLIRKSCLVRMKWRQDYPYL